SNDSTPTELSTLSLHDALPIWPVLRQLQRHRLARRFSRVRVAGAHRAGGEPARVSGSPGRRPAPRQVGAGGAAAAAEAGLQRNRSEEHTSELQSRENLVCRLLL